MVLLPDEKHGQVWNEQIRDGIAPGKTLLFGHGFSIHYGEVEPPPEVDVALVAPKGPGHLVRRQYLEGSGVPGLVAVHQNASGNALELTLAYAKGIGCTRGGVIETTFKDETETDLFGEQAVLCGGVSELVQAGYETLVDAGYDPKLAYFECLHELKLIVDLMYEKGISGMRYSISNTAEYGDYTRGKRIISDATRQAMKDVLGEIQSGAFAREWIAENRAGQENFQPHARGAGRPPDRARGQGAALDDGLDRDGVLSDEPTTSGWLPPQAPGGQPAPLFDSTPEPEAPQPEPAAAPFAERPIVFQTPARQGNGAATTSLVLGILGLVLLLFTAGRGVHLLAADVDRGLDHGRAGPQERRRRPDHVRRRARPRRRHPRHRRRRPRHRRDGRLDRADRLRARPRGAPPRPRAAVEPGPRPGRVDGLRPLTCGRPPA